MAVRDSQKCSANNSNTENRSIPDELFNLNNIDRAELQSITCKLKEAGILDTDETLEKWLSEMMPQITDGGNVTVPEIVTGLKQFLEI